MSESHDHCLAWSALIVLLFSLMSVLILVFGPYVVKSADAYATKLSIFYGDDKQVNENLTLEQLRYGFRMSPNGTMKRSLSFDDFISCLS